jgi:hypothetical protein
MSRQRPQATRLVAEEEARWSGARGEQVRRGRSSAMPSAAQLPWRPAKAVGPSRVQSRLVGRGDHNLHRPNGFNVPVWWRRGTFRVLSKPVLVRSVAIWFVFSSAGGWWHGGVTGLPPPHWISRSELIRSRTLLSLDNEAS